jgi:hypothetical protein
MQLWRTKARMSGEDVTGAVSRRAVRVSACRRRSGVEPLLSLMPIILSRCACYAHCSFSIFSFQRLACALACASLRPLALACQFSTSRRTM